ncbi:MAG TPA: preprotein translocase subunit SecY [Luteibaculaceae bacterium]|nr:preprotein translocase subunit SecY [Luteibaculaceae bacterium]
MKNFINTIKNIWKIQELKSRIITTLSLLLIYRIGSFVVLPGVNSDALVSASSSGGGIADLLSMFTGGAFSRASIFALGIMPYISASIIIQLLGLAVPAVQKMQKEGESGRKRLNQYTRLLTILICIFQAPSYIYTSVDASARPDGSLWLFTAVAILTAGTLFVMWLGEKITDKGLGNGTSLIIMIGIIANLPAALLQEFISRNTDGGVVFFLVEIVSLVLVVAFTIMLIQGTRRVQVQFAKKVAGAASGSRSTTYAGARQYIPLKVNSSGVMPIIFAQAIMFVPLYIGQAMESQNAILMELSNFGGLWYNVLFATMIIVFTYFYTAIMVNPNQMAEDMKRSGGFIPGYKPGQETSNYLDSLLSKLTLPGAIFLAAIAILPSIAMLAGVKQQFAVFYGGTSLLIMVGVVLDTLQQIESHLLSKHYDGLMKTGKVVGRQGEAAFGMAG